VTDEVRQYNRIMTRSAFQSLFWNVLLARKRQSKFTLSALADRLGINKSYISRSFANPPNWQIDKISDMTDALGVELIVQARDKATGVIYTPNGIINGPTYTFGGDIVKAARPLTRATGLTSEDHKKLFRTSAL
jgi:DNA-binding phage protein